MEDTADSGTGTYPHSETIPALGLGTWQHTDHEQCVESVRLALECGYRHLDTAQAYGNEQAVGEGLAAADVDREEVFLATKVWIDNLHPDDVRETARDSIDRLGVDAVDLLYVHWPAGEYDPEATLSAFDDLYDDGLIRGVGISNFEPDQVKTAVESCAAPILANQVECHPLFPQEKLRAVCAEYDLAVVAYSPLARGRVFEVPELQAVADKHEVSEAQVSLAWLREHGVVAIPKATGEEHILDNWASLDLDLDAEDRDQIDRIEYAERQVDPGFAPW